MVVQVEKKGDIVEVTPKGDLTASTIDDLKTKFAELADQQVHFILLNLWGVHFIDSTGLNLFIEAHKKILHQNGRIVFFSPSEAVSKVFKMTGANQKLIMAANREEGVQRLHD